MTVYNVHLYATTRVKFDGIEADSHEAAADIAQGMFDESMIRDSEYSDEISAALVDVAGDEEYEQSKTIELLTPPSPDWKAIAQDLAGALDACTTQLHQVKGMFPNDEGIANALQDADEATEEYDMAIELHDKVERRTTAIAPLTPSQDHSQRWEGEGDHPSYKSAYWRSEVDDGNTRLGYAEWVAHQIEAKKSEWLMP